MTEKSSEYTTPRSLVVICLVLAVVFTIAVIAGARVLMQRTTLTPVAMGPVDAPEADSPTCSDFASSLPQALGEFRNVGVLDPAPAGTAAFKTLGGAQLNVRCGVRLPDQYTVLSRTVDAGGAQWFEVKDATPGSDLHTWYTVNATPTVAVTGTQDAGQQLAPVGEHTQNFTGAARAPQPYPLGDIPMVSSPAADTVCQRMLDALPPSFSGYQRIQRDDAPSRSATYLSDGAAEPVVVRCGAQMPESYQAGERISQVDDVAWFAEPSTAQGSTSGRWFALSHEQIVAVSMPNDAGNAAVEAITTAISSSMSKVGS